MGAGSWGAHSATLTDATGRVQVASSADPADWRPVSNGDQVRTGQRLRTGPGSLVTLVYFDGSRTTLSAESEVTFERPRRELGECVTGEIASNRWPYRA